MLGTLLSVVAAGFLIGALARLAVPGPDPMPLSLTLLIGFAGSIVGGAIAAGIYGARHTFDTSGSVFVTVMLEIGVATLIVVAYRRFVQGRPLSGPEARRFLRAASGSRRCANDCGSSVSIPTASGNRAAGPPVRRPRPTMSQRSARGCATATPRESSQTRSTSRHVSGSVGTELPAASRSSGRSVPS